MILTKDQILAYKPALTQENVPELGGEVCLRVMSGMERDSLSAAWSDPKNKDRNMEAHVLVRSLVDEQGKRLFADDEVDRLAEVLSFPIITKLAQKASELNGLAVRAALDEAGKG